MGKRNDETTSDLVASDTRQRTKQPRPQSMEKIMSTTPNLLATRLPRRAGERSSCVTAILISTEPVLLAAVEEDVRGYNIS